MWESMGPIGDRSRDHPGSSDMAVVQLPTGVAIALAGRLRAKQGIRILAEVAPSTDELVYTHSDRGFALLSLRSPELSRYYVQVRHDEDASEWSDERIWDELDTRLASAGTRKLKRGPLTAKSVLPMRSQVTEPMRYGRVFMAGDAAHIVPPTGAKGLNLAFADVVVLARAFGHCGIAARLRRTGRELHGSLPGLTGPQPASGLSSFGSAPGNGVRVGHKP